MPHISPQSTILLCKLVVRATKTETKIHKYLTQILENFTVSALKRQSSQLMLTIHHRPTWLKKTQVTQLEKQFYQTQQNPNPRTAR